VRIEAGIAQRFRHALDQHVGHGVLETLSLLMDGFPTVAEEGDQVCLDDSVTADGAKSGVTAFERENYALVGNVLQQPLLGEPLDHPADRRSGKVQLVSNIVGCGRLPLLRQSVDSLEIILDRACEGLVEECGVHESRTVI